MVGKVCVDGCSGRFTRVESVGLWLGADVPALNSSSVVVEEEGVDRVREVVRRKDESILPGGRGWWKDGLSVVR